MRESKLLGVQELAVEAADAGAEACVLNRIVTAAAVSLVTYDRMLQPRKMDSDLMRSSGLELNIEECETIESTSHTEQRQRIAATPHDGHARTVRRIACQWLIDLSGICNHTPVDQRYVRLVDRPIAKLI